MPTFSPPTRFFPPAPTAALIAIVLTAGLCACATDRLDATAPSGVNLTGEWKLNLNLSDDPDKLGNPDTDLPRNPPSGGHRGHGGMGRGGGGAGGMPPIGSSPDGSYDLTSNLTGLSAPGIEEPAPLPPVSGTPASGSSSSRHPGLARMLQAADHLSIHQDGAVLAIKATMPDGTTIAEEYKAGTQTTISYGPDNTADRSVGWRGPIFVVTTKAKKGGSREDDYALDDDGRLIMATFAKGGRMGKVDIKRVYDRVRG